jgi:hypothetical protein
MIRAINQFRENIRYVRNLRGVYTAVRSMTTTALDLSDILRSQIVMGVSAMDCYVHAVARIGMSEIFSGGRVATNAYQKFSVSLRCATDLPVSGASALESEIRRLHGFLSFQDPGKISEAIRLVSPVELWKGVATALGETPDDVRESINLIVQRRNKIAHESDINHVDGSRWPISEAIVDGAINRIERVCEVIHTLV